MTSRHNVPCITKQWLIYRWWLSNDDVINQSKKSQTCSISQLIPLSIHPLPHTPLVAVVCMCFGICICSCLSQENLQQTQTSCASDTKPCRGRDLPIWSGTDHWWLVRLPVHHLGSTNPFYSPVDRSDSLVWIGHWVTEFFAQNKTKQQQQKSNQQYYGQALGKTQKRKLQSDVAC